MSESKSFGRKLSKLRRSPRTFLADSRNPALRILRAVIETGWPDEIDLPVPARHRVVLPAPATVAATGALSPREMVERSGLFDPEFYVSMYSDVRKRGIKDLLNHYLKHGSQEQRSPNELFDPRFYAQNAGIKPTDSPLLHYLREGEAKGICPHPHFDPAYYRTRHPDVVASGLGALSHYMMVGRQEGRQTCASIQPNPDISLEHDLREVRVVVLIPIYNNADHVRRCIESVLANTYLPGAELLLLDDASSELATRLMLDDYRHLPKVTLLRNEQNLGFTRTVNRGLRHAEGRDVVLLNSDTIVGPRWLEALATAAYGSRSIATATALSDSAGAFSTPTAPVSDTHGSMPVHDAARLSARAATEEVMFVPTGNGFCMYMRGDALADVGLLDELNFPRGYGEENDWCMRAVERGWQHVIALRAYAHHVNAVSFGNDVKERLRDEARLVLDRLHPDYGVQIKRAFGGKNALKTQRQFMNDAVERSRKNLTAAPRPRILFVLSTQNGGTPLSNDDLMLGVGHLYDALLLVCDAREMTLFDCSGVKKIELARHTLREGVPFVPHRSAEYDRVVTGWMVRYSVELLHVRHIAWHSLGLIEAARRQCIPVVFSFHDFYSVCPSVNLTNGKDAWCEAGVTVPHVIAPLWTRRDPEALDVLQKADASTFITMWQRRMNAVLAKCDAFVTTSPAIREILSKNLPVLQERAADFHVIPHGRDFDRFLPPASGPRRGAPLRVLVAGNITGPKGLYTVLELLEQDRQGMVELHTLGTVSPLLTEARAVHHGRYTRSEFLDRVRAIAPDVALIPTICPETFCHTLTECWAAGIPVIGSELGAVGERIRESGAGWSVDPHDVNGILSLMSRIASGQESWDDRAEAVRVWQATTGIESTVAAMAARYVSIYQEAGQRQRALLPAPGRRSAGLRQRIALVVRGHFPNSVPTTHVRIGTALGQASGEAINYEFIDAAELVHVGVRDFDGVVVCRNAGEPEVLIELARQCRSHDVPLVFDMDDDLLNVPPQKDATGDYARVRPALKELLATASLFTASTEPLAAAYADLTRNIRIVPNRLDPRVWMGPVAEYPVPAAIDQKAALRVIYMGSPTHQEDLELVLEAFARLRAQYGVQLYTIGVMGKKLPEGVVGIAPPVSRYDRFIPWFRAISGNFDAAIAPLVEAPFNRSKSDLKFLEYAACGLPTVASRVVPYSNSVRDGEDGLLVDNDAESWFQAVRSLATQPELRARLGAAALKRAEAEFMAQACIFDGLPWRDWRRTPDKTSPSSENGAHHSHREMDIVARAYEA